MKNKKEKKTGVDQVNLIIADISNKIKKGELSHGAKLDAEGILSQKYNTNVYCVRKAIRKLKQCGLVYSVPKFGVFIGKEEKRPDNAKSDVVMNHQIMIPLKIRIKTDFPTQYRIWENVKKEIQKNITDINLIYTLQSEDEGLAEIWTGMDKDISSGNHYVNMLKYFPGVLEYPPQEQYPCDVPYYYNTRILIYNVDLMKKHNLPLPSYQNFEEQNQYLKSVLSKITELGLKLPGTSQDFGTIIGMDQQHELFYDLAFQDLPEKTFLKKYIPLFNKAMEVYRCYHPDYPHDPIRAKVDFSLGNAPFFFGQLSDYQELKEGIKKFQVSGAMMYATDDTLLRIQISLGMPDTLASIMSQITVLQEFQKVPVQTIIAKTGGIPLKDELYSKLPYSLIIPPENNSKSVCYISKEEFYIFFYVIGVSLWRLLFTKESEEQIYHMMYASAKAYLKIQMDKFTPTEREAWIARHTDSLQKIKHKTQKKG